MTQIVPVLPGLSSVTASGPQYGVKYALVGPDGVRCTFNDPEDNDHVGYLTSVSGLDSPDVREAADDLVGDDGGLHGDFFYGRRPIVLEGLIDNRPASLHYELLPTGLAYVNLVTNPSLEVALTSWANQAAGTTATRDLTEFQFGIASLKIVTDGTVANQGSRYDFWDASLGSTYAARVWIKGTAGAAISLVMAERTSAGSFLSSSQTNITATGSWQEVTLTRTFSSSTVARGTLAVLTTGTLATTYYVDGVMVTEGTSAPTYFDGSTQPTMQAPSYTEWLGTANASMSRQVFVSNSPFDANRVRNIRMTALERATNAMRRDASLSFKPEGGVEQKISVRRQQPLRIAGGFNKTFQAALVSADYRIYGAAINEVRLLTPGTPTAINNAGTTPTLPVLTVFGPSSGTMTGIEVRNMSTGQAIVFAPAYALAPGQSIVIDMNNRTVARESGANIYDQVQFASSSWWQIEAGANNIQYNAAGTTTASSLLVRWQDAWV